MDTSKYRLTVSDGHKTLDFDFALYSTKESRWFEQQLLNGNFKLFRVHTNETTEEVSHGEHE